jgi:hypothetical protein
MNLPLACRKMVNGEVSTEHARAGVQDPLEIDRPA